MSMTTELLECGDLSPPWISKDDVSWRLKKHDANRIFHRHWKKKAVTRYRTPKNSAASSRLAFTVLDLLAAAVITAALVALTVQYLRAASDARRAMQRQTAALAEAANLMEIVFSWDYQQITAENIYQLQRQRPGDPQLSTLEFSARVDLVDDRQEAKRIVVEFQGKNPAGGLSPPVRLTAWRYQQTETSEAEGRTTESDQ
jgi:type II secretory pathway pseudopilin PulG